MQELSVLVVEDEEPLRAALCDLLDSEPGIVIAGTAGTSHEAIELAAARLPSVAIVDVRMPGGGPATVAGIHERSPDTRMLALSAYEDRATVFEMLRSGAVGYLVKGTPAEEIVEAVRRAGRGQASISAEVIAGVIEDLVHDMAEREQAQDEVRRSENLFRDLLESAPDAVVIVDESGEITLVNALTEQLFGYRRDELVGRNVDMLLPEAFRERHKRHRADYMAAPQTRPMGAGLELTGRRRDGSEFPVDIHLSSIETPEGRLVRASVRDVTEREAVESATRRSEELFRALLESAPDAVVIADPDGRIVLVNQQVERLFGYERDDLLGKPVETLLPERFHSRHVGQRADYLAEPMIRLMGAGLELAGRRRDGSEFPADISLSTIETPEGRLLTAFVRDITERTEHAQLERALEERSALVARLVAASEEERSRIAGDIHDDSIQAITAAGIRLQLLRRSLTDEDQINLVKELEGTIQLSISRLRHLLFELRPPALDHEGLSPALLMYVAETESQTNTRFLLDDRLRTQPGEDTRVILYRIAQEALTNVRKHAEAENATILLEDRDGGYLVRVKDDGVGFELAGVGPNPGHLGFVAMRERAALVGGRLRVESTPGEGTTVEIWIPQLPAPG